jgi:hypothetical protein
VDINLFSDDLLIHHSPIPQGEEANVLEWISIGTLTKEEFHERDTASIERDDHEMIQRRSKRSGVWD